MSDAGAQEPKVEFVEVEKTFDGLTNVVNRLSLAIYPGEFLTLLGPSGSGKTTTLLMLAGFEEPTAGDILLNCRSLRNVPPYRRNLGIVFQNYALFPHMTVQENIAYPLAKRGVPRAERDERVADALAMVKLEQLGERRPNQLSGGQQQRVALTRALVFEPDVVLLDEPLGALDRKLREEMQLELRHLHEGLGMTMLYVTHDQGEALAMSNRIAILNEGVVQQIGTPQEVYENPKSLFVANFVGENNNLNGVVEKLDGERCLVVLDGGARIEARAVNIERVGVQATLSVRPEQIAVGPRGTNQPNRVVCRVVELIYFGDHARLTVSGPGGTEIIIKLPAEYDKTDLRENQALEIGWRVEHCLALGK